jgi:hypothetical protein
MQKISNHFISEQTLAKYIKSQPKMQIVADICMVWEAKQEDTMRIQKMDVNKKCTN